MSRLTQAALLALLSVGIIRVALDGRYLRYVKPQMQPFLITGACVVAALAVIAFILEMSSDRNDDVHEESADHQHGASTSWLLVLPAAVIAFTIPPALGASATVFAPTTPINVAALPEYAPLPTTSMPVPLGLREIVDRTYFGGGHTLDDHVVETTGFIAKRLHGDEGFDIGRVVITCCAADAHTVRVHLDHMPVALPQDTWVRVTGTIRSASREPANTARNARIPTMDILTIESIPTPDGQYEY